MSIHGDGPPRRIRHIVAGVGTVFALAGFAGIGRVFIAGKDGKLLQISTTNLVIGVILVGQSLLSKPRSADDQTYRIGYDVGYEKGERDERDRPRPRPVIVALKRPWRPRRGEE